MLIACRECGKETSTEADACPHCGAPTKRKTGLVSKIVWAAIIIGVIWFVFPSTLQLLTPMASGPPDQTKRCTVDAITIKSFKGGFIDRCTGTGTPCPVMQGVAVLNNACDRPIGVQVKIVGLDSAGEPVASKDHYVSGSNNLPPGDYTFGVDHLFHYDSRIKTFAMAPNSVHQWP